MNAPGNCIEAFFICVGDQPELDFRGKINPDEQGFAAFGQVVEGMDAIRKIQQQKDDEPYLHELVRIQIENLKIKGCQNRHPFKFFIKKFLMFIFNKPGFSGTNGLVCYPGLVTQFYFKRNLVAYKP